MVGLLMTPTIGNLNEHAVEPMARWLIQAALHPKRKLTYGEVKGRLQAEYGFSTIFPIILGYPAGKMMWDLLAVRKSVPLLNVLLVRQDTQLPGSGAGIFLAEWDKKPCLKQAKARIQYPKLWADICAKAESEVRAYGKRQWAEVYRKTFGKPLKLDD